MSNERNDGSRESTAGAPATPTDAFSLAELSGEDLSAGSDVLLLGPMRRALDDEACAACLDAGSVMDRDVLFVSLTQTAEERLSVLQDRFGRLPARVSIVCCNEGYRSTRSGSRATDGGTDAGGGVTIRAVDDPSDLPKLGITVARAAADLDDSDETLICLHSITSLLQYAEPQRVFRFIHVLQNQLPGVRHYHMDVEAHDVQTVATLRQLFDRVVEYDERGTVTIED